MWHGTHIIWEDIDLPLGTQWEKEECLRTMEAIIYKHTTAIRNTLLGRGRSSLLWDEMSFVLCSRSACRI